LGAKSNTGKHYMKNSEWFSVDKNGLRELCSGISRGRLVTELVQNAWDESSTLCEVSVTQSTWRRKVVTEVVVRDDNPDGFRHLRDAYTLFGSTAKRSDPTKRGRFNFGDKMVISQARHATITTTKGTVVFGENGRSHGRAKTEAGSVVTFVFPRWSRAILDEALRFVGLIIPPAHCRTTLNGREVVPPAIVAEHSCVLPTELLMSRGGTSEVRRSERKTTITLRLRGDGPPMLFEMGLPICEIEGIYNVDVGHKVPLGQDRSSVSPAFLRDIYAELLIARQDTADLAELGHSVHAIGLRSARVSPTVAAKAFHAIHGTNAVLRSSDPDSNQLAERANAPVIPSSVYGAEVNAKIREGGGKTTKEIYGDTPANVRLVPPTDVAKDSQLLNFVNYARMLAGQFYGEAGGRFVIDVAPLERETGGYNRGGYHVVFNLDAIDGGRDPVSRLTSLIIHELAHCRGNGHDGVYDREYERLVNELAALTVSRPELFLQFEPGLRAP
jgi:hypothetical protein